MKKKYSVIIPIYKAENTLNKCVDSLLCQNYDDVEIILVNDGSPDNSDEICKTYSAQYENITYIEQENKGVSAARNAGLDIASGEYVLFVDSDDSVSGDYFAALEQIDESYDFVMFSHCLRDGTSETKKISADFISTNLDECVGKFCDLWCRKSLSSPVTKRYRKSIIQENNIRFPEHLYIGEDKSFNLMYIMHCKSCVVSSQILYYVNLENQNSLSRKIRPDLYLQLQMLTALTQKTIREADIPESYREQYFIAENLIQLRGIYSESKRMHITGENRRSRYRTIRRMCAEQNRSCLPLPGGFFTTLLKIPVRLRLVCVIDWVGRYLAG